jgi:hypothetical protein
MVETVALNPDKWKRAGAVLVAVLATGLTLYYLVYGFPQPVKHQRYVSEHTALRLMLRPAKVQHIVSDAVPGGLKYIPAMPRLNSTMGRPQRLDWLHYLPHEITLVVDQSPTGDLASVLFVNDNSSGPDFAEIVSDSRILAERVPFTWRPPALARDEDEALIARGTFDIAESAWQPPPQGRVGGPFDLPKASGNLIVDFAVDNGGAVLQALHDALRAYHGPALGDPGVDDALSNLWQRLFVLHARAKLEDNETIHVTVEAALDGSFDDTTGIDLAVESLRFFLADRAELSLEGHHELTPVSLRAEYRIIGVASRLEMALGRRGI